MDIQETSQRETVRKRYAFIKIRSKHTIIEQIIHILETTFPEYELELIDIKKLLRSNIHVIFINLFFIVYIYGVRSLLGGKSAFYNRFFGTPYMYETISRMLNSINRHDYLFTIQDCSLFNGKISGIPHFVYTDHTILANKNYPEFDEKRDLLSSAWMSLEASIYHDADIVFTRSQIVRNSVIQDYMCDPGKVQCIYYAPFSDDVGLSGRKDKYSSKTILFIGLEWERKGGPLLLRAFENVLNAIPDARLIIVGCKPSVESPNVEVVGPVPKECLLSFYEKAAVFCLPTRREPFGIVFIEAMRYSLPVVGTRIGAIPEIVSDQETGFLVSIDDVDNMSKILVELLSKPEMCERMGRRGHEVYRQRFSMNIVSSLLRKYISSCIASSDGMRHT